MDEPRLEMKVGALVLAALGGLVGLLWLMGELTLGTRTSLSVDFAHTGNVVKGAPVKLGGVTVGRVEEILLLPDRRDAQGLPLPVQMNLALSPSARAALRADSQVTVATMGPLGEPYLEVSPGSSQAEALGPGTVLRGTDAPRLELVAQQLSAFLDAASALLEQDPQLVQSWSGDVRTLIGELTETAREMRSLVHVTRTSLAPGGAGARLLDDAAATAAAMKRDLPVLSGSASRSLSGLAALAGNLTPEDGERLRRALGNMEAIASKTDRLLARIEAGEGTLGAFQKDPKLYEELRALVTDLRKHPWKVLWKD